MPPTVPTVVQSQSFGNIHVVGGTFVINQTVNIDSTYIHNKIEFNKNSPYVGLEKFDTRHTQYFFGRDREVGILLNAISASNLTLITGRSGSGKSSVVSAGLIPQLTKQLGIQLRCFAFTPDIDPFDNMSSSLQSRFRSESRAMAKEVSSNTLLRVSAELRPDNELWLFFIDQFEEIFTRCGHKIRQAFIDGLVRFASSSQSMMRVILAMRSDFFDQFGPYGNLAECLRGNLHFIADMSDSGLRDAIIQPAALHGVVYQDGLPKKILEDLQSCAGKLPLLQYTLNELWRADSPSDDKTINLDTYKLLGGVTGALKSRAQQIYQNKVIDHDTKKAIPRPDAERLAIRRVFLHLVDFTSSGADARPVNRRRKRAEFKTDCENELIDELIEEKLLVGARTGRDSVPLSGQAGAEQPTVEIAHEALFREWPLLVDWISEGREIIFLHNRISEDTCAWLRECSRDANHAEGDLWSGSRLARALVCWHSGDFDTVGLNIGEHERLFLEKSREVHDRKLRDKQTQAEREQALSEERRKAEEAAEARAEALRQRRLDALVEKGREHLTAGRWPEALPVLGQAYLDGSRNAALPFLLTQAGRASRSQLAVMQLPSRFPEGTVAYGLSGPRLCISTGPNEEILYDPLRQVELSRNRFVGTYHTFQSGPCSISDDLTRVLSPPRDGRHVLWDTETGHPIAQIGPTLPNLDQGRVDVPTRYAALCPGNRDLIALAGGREEGLYLHSVRPGIPPRKLVGGDGSDSVPAFSQSGAQVLAVNHDGTIGIWNTATGERVRTLEWHRPGVGELALSLTGRHVVTANATEGRIRIFDFRNGRLLHTIGSPQNKALFFVLSPLGGILLSLHEKGSPTVWTMDTHQVVGKLGSQATAGAGVAFSPDEKRIAIANAHAVEIWDIWRSKLLATLHGHRGIPDRLSFSPDGRRLLSFSREDSTARVWDTDPVGLTQYIPHFYGTPFPSTYDKKGRRRSPLFSFDGCRLIGGISGSPDAVICDLTNGKLVQRLPHGSALYSAAFAGEAEEDTRVLTVGYDSIAIVWSLSLGDPISTLAPERTNGDIRTCLNQDGTRAITQINAILNSARRPVLWDVKSSKAIREFCWSHSYTDTENATVTMHGSDYLLKFSPDGQTILIYCETFGSIEQVDVTNGQTIAAWTAPPAFSLETGELSKSRSTVLPDPVFSADGKLVALPTRTGKVFLWKLTTKQLTAIGQAGETPVTSLALSPDGANLATVHSDGRAMIWEIQSETLRHQLRGPGSAVSGIDYSPDGHLLATAHDDGTACIWDSESCHLLQILSGPQGALTAVAFSPDLHHLVTFDRDGDGACIWRVDIQPALAAFGKEGCVAVRKLLHLAVQPQDGTPSVESVPDLARAEAGETLLTHAYVALLRGQRELAQDLLHRSQKIFVTLGHRELYRQAFRYALLFSAVREDQPEFERLVADAIETRDVFVSEKELAICLYQLAEQVLLVTRSIPAARLLCGRAETLAQQDPEIRVVLLLLGMAAAQPVHGELKEAALGDLRLPAELRITVCALLWAEATLIKRAKPQRDYAVALLALLHDTNLPPRLSVIGLSACRQWLGIQYEQCEYIRHVECLLETLSNQSTASALGVISSILKICELPWEQHALDGRRKIVFNDIQVSGQNNTVTIGSAFSIASSEVRTRPFNSISPYLGLRRFEEQHRELFFGRDLEIKELLRRMSGATLFCIAGASGSGKSSLVRAGLIPEVANQLLSGKLSVTVFTPDRNPFESLASALVRSGFPSEIVSQMLESNRLTNIADLVCRDGNNWLVFVDQFEEIFTFCREAGLRHDFLSGLDRLTERTDVRVIIALRADFFDQLASFPELAEKIAHNLYLLTEMQPSSLQQAIEQPAARHGVVFEEGLVEQIIADVKGQPGSLPLLQYTLDLLWRTANPADDRILSQAAYHKLGGVGGALCMRADEFYQFIPGTKQTPRPPEQQEAMRRIYLRLVDFDSAAAGGRVIARRTQLGKWLHDEERSLINELVSEKLLIVNSIPGGGTSVELSQSALLYEWPIYKTWIDESRQLIIIRNEMTADASRWADVKQQQPDLSVECLWTGSRLTYAHEMQERGQFDIVLGGLSALEKTFLEASVKHRNERIEKQRHKKRRFWPFS